MRAPPPVSDVDHSAAVQVDHHIGALRVNGSSFVGQGWYVYGNHNMKIETLFAPVRQQAVIGMNLMMPCESQ